MVLVISGLSEFWVFHQELNWTTLEVFVCNVVNLNPKTLWEIVELITTDQIKLNKQLYGIIYAILNHRAR